MTDQELANIVTEAANRLNIAIRAATDAGLKVEIETAHIGTFDNPDGAIVIANVSRMLSGGRLT